MVIQSPMLNQSHAEHSSATENRGLTIIQW